MILLLAGLTVLTFKYSRDTVTREAKETLPTATRPLGPDQIARLRPPEPPDLGGPEPEAEAVEPTRPVLPRWRPPRRSSRPNRPFEVRRPGGGRQPGPRLDRVEETAGPANRTRPDLTEDLLARALTQPPPGPQALSADARQAEPRRFEPSPMHAVAVDYREPLTPYEVKAGSYLPALLSHAVSSELAGPVRAQVSRDVYDSTTHRHLLIPRGTTLLGVQARQPVAGERRVTIVWERLVFPDGRSVDLASGDLTPLPSASADGTLGLLGRVNRHWPRRLATAGLVSLVGAGVQLSQPQRSATGLSAASPGQVAAGELGLELGRLSQRFLDRTIDQPPTIELAAGARVFVWITRDLAFPQPYSSR